MANGLLFGSKGGEPDGGKIGAREKVGEKGGEGGVKWGNIGVGEKEGNRVKEKRKGWRKEGKGKTEKNKKDKGRGERNE